MNDYDDIPGTFVFDAERSREGYHLNQFCISLRLAANREAFNADEDAYLDRYPMSAEQRAAVRAREWNRLLELGGNIYYTSKLAANDGINFQQLAGLMTGMGESYRDMMLSGGRSIEGNRYQSEWDAAGAATERAPVPDGAIPDAEPGSGRGAVDPVATGPEDNTARGKTSKGQTSKGQTSKGKT